jgi:chemotaxis protein histidine kinase CheA
VKGDVSDLLPLFLEEAGSRLDRLVALLGRAAEDPDAAVQVRRELHALKGASRMMGMGEVADLCHKAEDCLVGTATADFEEAKTITDRLTEILDELEESSHAAAAGADPRVPTASASSDIEIRGGPGELRVATRVVDGLAERSARMRVSAKAGNTLVKQLFEIASSTGRSLEDQSSEEVLATLLASVRHAALELEGMTKLLQQLSEEQLDAVLRLQVQPLRPFLRTLARHTRELALSLGKQVKVTTSGGDVQLDRRILEAIREAALHLIRNAVDHGIEDSTTRSDADKEPEGHIHLGAEADGDRVRLFVSDDGHGIDPAVVIDVAVDQGLVSPAAASRLSPDEAYQLLYLPGFTTREIATDVSGRGVGLDAVEASIRAIGGDLWIRSTLGEGSRVTVEVPVTRRGEGVLVVQVGQLQLAMPSAAVRSFRRLRPEMVVSVEEERTLIQSGNARMAAVFLSRLLGQPDSDNAVLIETTVGGTNTAVVVDAILGEEEVFVRPLPVGAGAPRSIEGVALVSSGRPVPVLSLKRIGHLDLSAPAQTEADQRPGRSLSVLLVEDSKVTREMLRRLLEQGGLAVTAVTSAEEAIQRLEKETPDCVVTDIEMPGLSGIDLTSRLRSSERFSELPVVVVSTRHHPGDRLAGLEAGADAYLAKQELNGRELIALIRRVAGGTAIG